MKEPLVISLFAVVFCVIVLFLTRNKRTIKQLRTEWDSGKFVAESENMISVSSYWRNLNESKDNYFGIDQITWDDLSMAEIFDKVNYTKTSVGAEYLFNQFRDIQLNKDFSKDERLYHLMNQNDALRENLLLHLTRLGKLNYSNSSAYFLGLKTNKIKHSLLYIVLATLPIISLISIFFSPFLGIIALIISFVFNIFVYYRNKPKLENEIFSNTYAASIIDLGKRISVLKNDGLGEHILGLKENVEKLSKVVKYSKVNKIGKGNNSSFELFFEYIRIIFLIDFLIYNKVMKVISSNYKSYENVWKTVGKIDAAIAVAYYRKSLKYYSKPSFSENEEVTFKDMAHPLLDKPVVNSSLLHKLTLITGSNASGKSTYIKAIAINAILAQTINTVLAKEWSMKPSFVITSMAIQDDLLKGDSYFIAEIKSLKRILNVISHGQPVLSFVDEILKGTNTIERIAASAAIMKWFSVHEGMNVLASHDIELTEISESLYSNQHFREKIEDGRIIFDYKVHEGPSKTRNAIKLLDLLEFPSEIISAAENIADKFGKEHQWLKLRFTEKI